MRIGGGGVTNHCSPRCRWQSMMEEQKSLMVEDETRRGHAGLMLLDRGDAGSDHTNFYHNQKCAKTYNPL